MAAFSCYNLRQESIQCYGISPHNLPKGNGIMDKTIEYILEVARCGGIAKAARNLYITPSALSKYIIQKEEDLGGRLFNRIGNKFTLTYPGERYVEMLKELREKQEEAVTVTRRQAEAGRKLTPKERPEINPWAFFWCILLFRLIVRNGFQIKIVVSLFSKIGEFFYSCAYPHLRCSRISPEDFHFLAIGTIFRIKGGE